MALEELDEKGFVFLDHLSRPFWCRMYGDEPWFMYWHANQCWVTLRKCTQTEVWNANQKKLARDTANMLECITATSGQLVMSLIDVKKQFDQITGAEHFGSGFTSHNQQNN